MIPFKQIRSTIIQGVKSHTGLMVIEMNGGGDAPSGSYLTYDFSEGLQSGRGFPIVAQHENQQTITETVNFTVSFLSYANDKATSIENAMLTRDFFTGIGRLMLKDENIVVVQTGAVDNRDISIGNEWERRQGFDVEFRTQSISEYEMNVINKIELLGRS